MYLSNKTASKIHNLILRNLIDFTIEKFGTIDILFLSAGVSAHMMFEDMKDLKAFEKLMQINFFGMIYPTKYAMPYLKQSRGQIVAMSSFSGEIGLP
jgi:NAD(P)-dependent dehydrogenase (short-subunit alcohol dehydrogenase family)